MNLKKLLNGNADQLLTSQDYRIASQLRRHAGKMLLLTTPLVAIGAIINSPGLMIPALYIPSALLIPPINYFLMKTVPAGNKSVFGTMKNALFNPVIGIGLLIFSGAIYEAIFSHASYYARHHGMLGHELRFQAHNGWTLVVAGLAMTAVCGWLSYTLARGKRTQSMQRIAQHLAIQEAENA